MQWARPVAISEFEELEEWVDESDRLVVIGQAAHPFPVGHCESTFTASRLSGLSSIAAGNNSGVRYDRGRWSRPREAILSSKPR